MELTIVGGGIGGLAAAAFLQRAGIEASVFEQASELTEIGAGLVLAPNAVRLVRRLGLHERLAEVAVRLETGWQFRRWEDGRVLFSQEVGDRCEALYGEAAWTIHRADLVGVLAGAVDPATVHLGARFAGCFERSEPAVRPSWECSGKRSPWAGFPRLRR